MSSELPDTALPGLFQAGDAVSIDGQSRFLRASRARLLLLVAGAVSGALSAREGSGADIAAAATVAALLGALLLEVMLIAGGQERGWYRGRAVAESAKTLAWRYAVGGAPFQRPAGRAGDDAARRRLLELLATLTTDAPGKAGPGHPPAITDAMRALRQADLEHRRRVYLTERIQGQATWYGGKARWNRVRARRWRSGLLTLEASGVLLAVLRLAGAIDIELSGFVATGAAAGVAWLSLKQHESLSRAYAQAADELAMARVRLVSAADEAAWSAEVDSAELAISREHTMWRAFRSVP